MGGPEAENVEGGRGGMRVEAPKGPVGQECVWGREGDRGGPKLSEGHRGRVWGEGE